MVATTLKFTDTVQLRKLSINISVPIKREIQTLQFKERADIYTNSAAIENHLIKPTFGLKLPLMFIMIFIYYNISFNQASSLKKIHRQHLNESIVIKGLRAHYSQNIRARKSDGKSL